MLTGMGGAGQGGPPGDTPQVDTAEQIYISSLALLKMLKHGEQQLHVCSLPWWCMHLQCAAVVLVQCLCMRLSRP
jgi:hypothetical protein